MLVSNIKTATRRKLELVFFFLLPLNGNHEISQLHLRRLGKGMWRPLGPDLTSLTSCVAWSSTQEER